MRLMEGGEQLITSTIYKSRFLFFKFFKEEARKIKFQSESNSFQFARQQLIYKKKVGAIDVLLYLLNNIRRHHDIGFFFFKFSLWRLEGRKKNKITFLIIVK
jgi:hypothetical protein